MSKAKSETVRKAMLKNLCYANGWSYAVFWGFNLQNPLLLTLRDAYYDEQMGGLIDDMRLQVHILGSGLVGQVAFTKKHKWVTSDPNSAWQSRHGLADIYELLQEESEFSGKFSCGIKTIAVVSVEPFGVIQFGSMEKLPERMEFIFETKKLFQDMDVESFLPEISLSSSVYGETLDPLESLPCPDFADLLEFDCQFQKYSAEASLVCDIPLPFSPPAVGQANYRAGDASSDDMSCATSVILAPNLSEQTDLLNVCNSFCQAEKNLNASSVDNEVFSCTSQHSIGSENWASNSLFSKLGLDQFLNDNCRSSFASYSCNDQLFAESKRRTRSGNPLVSSKNQESPTKPFKKKAKRGTRPVPKDRVRTYERLAELRTLVPNGEKMSIDCLLNQTIKHLLFLQSVTRRAEGLKKANEKKGLKETGFNSNGSGVTWACEIENQTMVCPLKVEELCTPGQMLIEILCQEQGFFLEIVEVVRGFGLNILEGAMEHRACNKIWAHFVVEAENKIVTRHQIFSSLLQLLELGGPSEELCVNAEVGDGRIRNSPLNNNCSHSPAIPFRIGIPARIPCTNLLQ
ncbi:unnamed protein product [Cuscuta campestris]|uniref:BHLH domain-containing protein n=1 Tax=Cuscuta campestris TaxID=132261 RepID=A0A484K2U7_9ASTE|nr:unnamed protein product [Cuscuta campestris]